MLLLLAVLPTLFWDASPETAPALREAGITRIAVPAAQVEAWKNVAGIAAEAADIEGATKLPVPSVDYQINRAGATGTPWLNGNGWRFLRQPGGRFYYDVRGVQAPLAAAEAFMWGAAALIRTDAAGLKPLADMLAFLRGVGEAGLPPVADIGFIDDGSSVAGEVMNMMTRGNLLFHVAQSPDRRRKLNVQLGSKEFPREAAADPAAMAQEIRAKLTDDRRSVRVFGSQVVVARLEGSGSRLRVHLLNYAGERQKVDGIRVRLLGRYTQHRLAAAGRPEDRLLDFTAEPGATEFTVRELKTYAVIDLSR